MSQLEQMRMFVRVVEAGGIGKAADQLGMAKSGVSRRLAELESRLGVTLLNRTTRKSSLTEAGQAFYQGAVKLIGDITELDTVVTDTSTSLRGRLRLAVPLSFGLCHLSSAIDAFAREHPELTIDIDFSDRHVDLVVAQILHHCAVPHFEVRDLRRWSPEAPFVLRRIILVSRDLSGRLATFLYEPQASAQATTAAAPYGKKGGC